MQFVNNGSFDAIFGVVCSVSRCAFFFFHHTFRVDEFKFALQLLVYAHYGALVLELLVSGSNTIDFFVEKTRDHCSKPRVLRA